MKKYILLFILLSISHLISAQSIYKFTFEDEIPSDQWIPEHGTYSLSTDHFMEGQKSLCWETPAIEKSVFTVSFTGFTSGSFAAFFNIHNAKPTENTLTVEFIDNNGATRKTANVSLNFRGWREFNRSYGKDFQSALSVRIEKVRFTLNNHTGEAHKLFFDNVDFKAATDASRQATDLMVLDVKQIESGKAVLLSTYANPIDIEATEPTAQEISDMNTIKSFYSLSPQSAQASELRTVRNYISTLNITRNEDGSIKGKVMPSGSANLTKEFMIDITRKLEAIAYSAQTSETDKVLFNDFLDYIIDQGFIYKYQRLTYSDYTTVRTLPRQLLNIIPVCSDVQKEEVLKMAKWMIEYGIVYADPAYLTKNLNSDYLYLYFNYLYSYAVHQPDTKDAVREVKALTRFIERSLEYTDGSYEVLKRDGTGFHHNTHFNGYMYTYNTWVDAIYRLKGTGYRISLDAYKRLRHAAMGYYIMSNKGASDGNYYANSLCGRHPFYGIKNNFSRSSFEKLIEIGGDIQGKGIDEELAAAYNYFLSSDKYEVEPGNYDGFYQFNYSPIGVYRKDNWVVTMRAPTTKFWGAEIYNATNRFGRYQSHGTLEVMYDGALSASGLPSAAQGWDWNVVPGTTTVHYTSWQEMMPNRNAADRFDQYTKTKNFAGALTWNDCGIFASDFDQDDRWGGQRFTPTNLEFKKSVFAFDGMLISMGSNIQSDGAYSDDMITATNLFQSIKSPAGGSLNINGQIMEAGSPDIIKSSDENFWIVTPEGTGYYLPKGNDKIVIKYGEQEGPVHTGADVNNPAKAVAAKAYIEHGVKPSGKDYLFVVVPGTTQETMQTISSRIGDDGGELFQVESRNEKIHALTYKPAGITAYSFFEATEDIDFGIVKSTGSDMLLMHKTLADTRMSFAIANPDLYPTEDGTKWVSSPTETHITVKGKWYLDGEVEGITVNPPQNDETTIHIHLAYGEPKYFNLKPEGYNSMEQVSKEEWVTMHTTSIPKEIILELNKPAKENITVEVFSLDGIKVQEKIIPAGIRTLRTKIDKDNVRRMNIIKVSTQDGASKIFKCLL